MSIKIERIEIQGYRSCLDCAFTPNEGLSALIGPNGAGKTSVLLSILLLSELAGMRTRWRSSASPLLETTDLKVWLDVNGRRVIHSVEAFLDTNEQNVDRIVKSKQTWYMKEITGSAKRLKVPLSVFEEIYEYSEYVFEDSRRMFVHPHFAKNVDLEALESKEVTGALSQIAKYYSRITYYSASQFTNPSLCPVSIEVTSDDYPRPPRGAERHRRWLHDLYNAWQEQDDSFKNYADIIGPNGIGLINDLNFIEMPVSNVDYSVRVGGKVVKRQKEQKLVIPQFISRGSNLSPSQLSEGTFKTLAMLFYLLTARGSIVLLEEPEVCIHHGLLTSIIELIKDRAHEKQLIISTHSDYILDALDESQVFVVRKDNEAGTSITSLKKYLKKDDLGALRSYLREEGSLGEYWRMGGLDD